MANISGVLELNPSKRTIKRKGKASISGGLELNPSTSITPTKNK
nr:MAG TPA: hypothetical protein [Caudoviricetes sp.]